MAKEKVNPAWMFETDFDGVAYHYKRNRKKGEPSLDEAIKEINESSSAADREKALDKAMGVTNRRTKRLPGDAAEGQTGDVVGAKKGGMIKSSASKRADGIAIRGKTRA
jgi:hypothetical protein